MCPPLDFPVRNHGIQTLVIIVFQWKRLEAEIPHLISTDTYFVFIWGAYQKALIAFNFLL